ncbi:MAG: response regulator [Candidatus Thiodiazotropha sp. DIVDIV]
MTGTANKKALIVDDSKTARKVLSSKLKNYGVAVDTRESAAAAIDYLYENAPDAIFMDYEMPGMDGFQALKVIKSNPNTAVIPVMMYTSKAGGLELSQARALGAIGVLPKQLESKDFEGVLNSLHLLPEQESLVHGFKNEGMESVRQVHRPDNVHPISDHERHKPALVETVSLPMDDFQQGLSSHESLKRFFRKEHNMAEERLQQQLDKQFSELRGEMYELEAMQEEHNSGGWRSFLVGALGGIVALAGVSMAYFSMDGSELMVMDKGQIEQDGQLVKMLSDQNEQIERLTQQLNNPESSPVGEDEVVLPLRLIEWAANQGTEFSFGEQPFSDEKALWLSELVGQLKESGFRGTIELRANHGNFCLQKGSSEGLALAKNDLDIKSCQFAVDHRGSNDWLNDQSVAFANYINVELARSGGEIEIILFSNGFDEPLMPYPALYEVSSAGDWNAIAAQNQRVQVNLYSN